MNDASNFPESEQPEGIPTASDAAQEADANTSAQAQTPADDNAAAARTCPQCGAALKPGASFCANCGAPVDGSDDVTYHIVRPEAERSYEDANFQPSDDAANTPPRYSFGTLYAIAVEIFVLGGAESKPCLSGLLAVVTC